MRYRKTLDCSALRVGLRGRENSECHATAIAETQLMAARPNVSLNHTFHPDQSTNSVVLLIFLQDMGVHAFVPVAPA